MMFIYGFLTCALLVFILYMFISAGVRACVRACVKDKKMAIAVYKTKTDTWEITDNFGLIVDKLENRRKYRPHTIKKIK